MKPGIGPCDNARFSVLTPREHEVMMHIVSGQPNKVIAAELGVSQRTVEAHRARIFQKLKVRNAVELTHLYWGQTPISSAYSRNPPSAHKPGSRAALSFPAPSTGSLLRAYP